MRVQGLTGLVAAELPVGPMPSATALFGPSTQALNYFEIEHDQICQAFEEMTYRSSMMAGPSDAGIRERYGVGPQNHIGDKSPLYAEVLNMPQSVMHI